MFFAKPTWKFPTIAVCFESLLEGRKNYTASRKNSAASNLNYMARNLNLVAQSFSLNPI